ncbi:MAG TPA: toll/interleukin-1 receptor domain-containing protein [Actinophytocola sp.]|uniref:toll/interleukin-1 receptor domain-containing protein n=1 Tax=Actinophytocola sp. TaxID=1872138 RepID=UPI002DDD8F43|nr:toll/interleukin-1 receptor domain-containing protein [Actinophytocola sp.]HEV2781167.1 toll/interleukin-1 receptor domain-containing protein [Actinophytocola sp.]
MGGIFISYRRGPHETTVGALADRLRHYFGEDQVFVDTQLTPGAEYPKELYARLLDSDVLVAVIHDGWVDEFEGPRHKDWVQFEIATALTKHKHVVPVLLEKVDPPQHGQLPEKIVDLADKQVAYLRGAEFRTDVDELVRLLEHHVAPVDVRAPESATPAKPKRVGRQITAWATALSLLALILFVGDRTEDQQDWEWLAFAAFTSTMALAASSILMAALIPVRRLTYRLDVNWQTMSTREFMSRTWILPALAILPLVYGMIKTWPGADGTWQEWEVWFLILLGIFVLYFGHRSWRHHGARQNAWPPLVTTEPVLFRRAAHRLHEKLTTEPDWRGPRTRAIQREAVSVYLDLAETRLELRTRATVPLGRWIDTGYSGWTTAWLGWLTSILALDGFALGLALHLDAATAGAYRLIGVTVLAALTFTAGMSIANFYADRWEVKRWIRELTEWQARLGPLVFCR